MQDSNMIMNECILFTFIHVCSLISASTVKRKLFLCWRQYSIALDYPDIRLNKNLHRGLKYTFQGLFLQTPTPSFKFLNSGFQLLTDSTQGQNGQTLWGNLHFYRASFDIVLFQSFHSAASFHWAWWTLNFAVKVTAQFFFLSAAVWMRGCGIFVLLIDNGRTDGLTLTWGVHGQSLVVHSEAS